MSSDFHYNNLNATTKNPIIANMKKTLVLSLIFVIACLFFSCTSRSPLIILYNGDIRGEYEPCSCPNKPVGGLERRVHLIKTISKEVGPDNVIIVDSGNLLSPSPFPKPPSEKVIHRSCSVLGETYKGLGLASIAIGPLDLMNIRIDELLKLQNSYSLPLISANLTNGDGKNIYQKSIRVKVAKRTIEIIGITSPKIAPPGDEVYQSYLKSNGLFVKNPLDELPNLVEKAKKHVDLVILLSNLGLKNDEQIAKAIPGIDIIIGGGGYQPLENPVLVEKTLIFRESVQGRNLGLIEFVSKNKYRHQIIPITKNVALDSEVKRIVEKYK